MPKIEQTEQISTPLSLEEQPNEVMNAEEHEHPDEQDALQNNAESDDDELVAFVEDDDADTATDASLDATEQQATEHTAENAVDAQQSTMAPFGFPHNQFAAPQYERRSGNEEADLFVQFRNRWHAAMQANDEGLSAAAQSQGDAGVEQDMAHTDGDEHDESLT